MPFAADREAAHGDAVDGLDARAELVVPADVIARAGGDDLDLGVPGEPFGDVARVQLGAAVDVGAVALNDDRELHDSAGPPVGLAEVRAGLFRLRSRASPGGRWLTPADPGLARSHPVRPGGGGRADGAAASAVRPRQPTWSR